MSMFRNLLMQIGVKPTPEYTQLEYIEGTGTQYINTGVYATNNTDFEIDMYVTKLARNFQQYLASNRNADYVPKLYAGSQTVISIPSRNGGPNVDVNNSFNVREKIKILDTKVYLNDNLHGSFNDNSRTIGTDSLPMYVFNSSSESSLISAMRLYSLKFWENGVLIKDFIPVLDSNNIVCLYDKVNDEYHYNIGTGDFVAGPIVNS